MLCATSYDSRAALEMKYGVSAVGATLGQLSADVGVRVVHGVDATAMDAGAIGDGYDLIVFNFPKVDATTREEFRIAGRVPRNRYLIAGFLVSAARLLNEKTGTILIAQKMGHPYRCWTCTQAVGWAAEVDALRRRRCGAEGGGVDTVRRLAYGFNMPFVQGIFPGYKCANVSPEDGGRRRKGFSVKGADGSATAQLHVFSMLPQPAPCNNNNGCSTEGGEVPPQEGGDGALRCATCDIAFASESDLKSHLSGKRHRLNARNTGEWSRYLEYLETSSTSAESSSSSSCSSPSQSCRYFSSRNEYPLFSMVESASQYGWMDYLRNYLADCRRRRTRARIGSAAYYYYYYYTPPHFHPTYTVLLVVAAAARIFRPSEGYLERKFLWSRRTSYTNHPHPSPAWYTDGSKQLTNSQKTSHQLHRH